MKTVGCFHSEDKKRLTKKAGPSVLSGLEKISNDQFLVWLCNLLVARARSSELYSFHFPTATTELSQRERPTSLIEINYLKGKAFRRGWLHQWVWVTIHDDLMTRSTEILLDVALGRYCTGCICNEVGRSCGIFIHININKDVWGEKEIFRWVSFSKLVRDTEVHWWLCLNWFF